LHYTTHVLVKALAELKELASFEQAQGQEANMPNLNAQDVF